MERITMLGTGAALVTKIYNTCFTLSDDANGEHFLENGEYYVIVKDQKVKFTVID